MREEEIPADMAELAKQYRDHMLESISDEDEEIMMLYLEGEEIPEQMIKTAHSQGDHRLQDRAGDLRIVL